MKQSLIFWITLLLPFSLFSQACPDSAMILTSQAQVDSFKILYSTCTQTGNSLTITGPDIVNLDSLSNLVRIKGDLIIENTGLKSLAGLSSLNNISFGFYIRNNAKLVNLYGLGANLGVSGNLEIINNDELINLLGLSSLVAFNDGLLNIQENDQLQSLEGLENVTLVRYDSATKNHIIKNNPKLKICNTQSICKFINSGPNYEISNNGPGCSNRDRILRACGFFKDPPNSATVFVDGFENWEFDVQREVPVGWELAIDPFGWDLENIQKVNAITEGEYAISLRNKFWDWDVWSLNYIQLQLEEPPGYYDITLSIQCLGSVISEVYLTRKLENGNTMYQLVERSAVGDTSIQQLFFPRINIEGNQKYTGLYIVARPVNNNYDLDGFLTIDDVKITRQGRTSVNENLDESDAILFPNPALDILFIETPPNWLNQFQEYAIYNLQGQLLKSNAFTHSITVQEFNSGIYLIRLMGKAGHRTLKWIKN